MTDIQKTTIMDHITHPIVNVSRLRYLESLLVNVFTQANHCTSMTYY